MSTTTQTSHVDAIRDALGKDWHSEATAHHDGFILHEGQNGVVAVTVGSLRTRPEVRPSQRTSDHAANVRSGFMSDWDRDWTLAQIEADLKVSGWNAVRMGSVVIVDGRA